jgi:hypothetical protein
MNIPEGHLKVAQLPDFFFLLVSSRDSTDTALATLAMARTAINNKTSFIF